MRFPRRLVAGVATAITLAIPLIAGFEGKENSAYLDAVKVPTICYGHTAGVKVGDYKTDAQCWTLLVEDARVANAAIDRLVTVPLPDHVRASLISFVYNVGSGNFAGSTLLRKLNSGDIAGACNQLPRWVYAKGVKLNGLVRRRSAERAVCLGEPNADAAYRVSGISASAGWNAHSGVPVRQS